MITETSGFSYLGTDCGYKWTPSTSRGQEAGTSLGKPIAVIMDGTVVKTFTTYPPIWEVLQNCAIVDVTTSHSVAEGHAVVDLRQNETIVYTLHISNELLAAAMTSSPTLVEISEANSKVSAGWSYSNGIFTEPA